MQTTAALIGLLAIVYVVYLQGISIDTKITVSLKERLLRHPDSLFYDFVFGGLALIFLCELWIFFIWYNYPIAAILIDVLVIVLFPVELMILGGYLWEIISHYRKERTKG